MKISSEAADQNRRLINKMQKEWKQEEQLGQGKNIKTPLHYFKEIKEVTEESFEVGTYPVNNIFERGVYTLGYGDKVQPLRPGSQDFLKHKSKGLGDKT
jgi:hypothetical protein